MGQRWRGDALLDAANKADQKEFINEWRLKLGPILAVASIRRDAQQTCTAFNDVLDSTQLQLQVQPLRVQDESREAPSGNALAASMPPCALESIFLLPIEVELSQLSLK
jgi:hypothetical protein